MGWAWCGMVAVVVLGLIAALAFPAGAIHWRPRLADWQLRLARVMVAPALAEELVFRGFLIPARGESHRPGLWLVSGLVLFVVWHVVEALTFLPGAHLFLTVPFLVCALILGAGCALMRYRTGSLWPAVIFHGLTVWLWQVLFAGPDVAQLMKQESPARARRAFLLWREAAGENLEHFPKSVTHFWLHRTSFRIKKCVKTKTRASI